MSNDLGQFDVTTADWRNSLRRNNFRTRVVILIFFLIYCGIGMLVDMYLGSMYYPQATISQLFHALITLQLFPAATCVMLFIASLSLLISYSLYDKIMLLGTEYHEITPTTAQNVAEQQLYNVVEEMKIAAGLRYMPKVFIIDADYMNAFASGYSESQLWLPLLAV